MYIYLSYIPILILGHSLRRHPNIKPELSKHPQVCWEMLWGLCQI